MRVDGELNSRLQRLGAGAGVAFIVLYVVSGGFIALLALLVWVLTSSVLLWRESPATEPVRTAAAAA